MDQKLFISSPKTVSNTWNK